MYEVMKNMKIIMVLVLLCLVVIGCSEQRVDIPTESDRTIILKAALSTTKGSIDGGSSFTASVVGWETSATVDCTSAINWHSTALVTASSTSSAIDMQPEQLYNGNYVTQTYIKAWHPSASPTVQGTVIFAGTQDGTTDVLFADAVVGSIVTLPKPLVFKHMLTQLKFQVVGDVDYVTKGNAVTSIVINGVELPAGINLSTNDVIYSAAADIALPSVTTPVAITSTPSAVGSAVMMKPVTGNTIIIDVKTSIADYDGVLVTIDTDSNFVPGKAYTITLNFAGQGGISVGSTVSEWKAGSGSGQTVD